MSRIIHPARLLSGQERANRLREEPDLWTLDIIGDFCPTILPNHEIS